MRISQITSITEGLKHGEYYLWTAKFKDGSTQKIKTSGNTTKEQIEAKFGKPVDEIEYSWAIHGGTDPMPKFDKDYHTAQDAIERGQLSNPQIHDIRNPNRHWKGLANEGSNTGLNRWSPGYDVNYEKVLDDDLENDKHKRWSNNK